MAGVGEPPHPGRHSRFNRLSANDLATLASDRGPAPFNIAALLVIDRGSELDFETVRSTLETRLPRVPRLRQRLRTLPPGLGRPIWVDDERFDVRAHVREVSGPLDAGAGDRRRSLLDLVADATTEPLPRDRPLWRACWAPGLSEGRAGLVIVLHHVVADGLGGLAALAALTDGPLVPSEPGEPGELGELEARNRPFPAPVPSPAALAADAWAARIDALRRARSSLSTTRDGLRELDLATHAPRLVAPTTINRPTGPRRAVSVASLPLAAVVETAHAHGATVNDVVLVAVGGAMGRALARRGEVVAELVVSVPVSARRATVAGRLGNETGSRPIRVPMQGDCTDRLAQVAQASAAAAARAGGSRAASAAPLLTVFRGLARLGLLRWVINHQRLVHTFVTNVRGPAEPLHLLGHRVSEIVPVAVTPGNVGLTFDVLSYAGELVVTVLADPAVVPDHPTVAEDLLTELGELTGRRA